MDTTPLACVRAQRGLRPLGVHKGNIVDSVLMACVRAQRGLGTLEVHKGNIVDVSTVEVHKRTKPTLHPWHV